MKKWLASLSLASLVLVLGACGGGEDESAEDTEDTSNASSEESGESGQGGEGGQSQEMPEPDLENVPDVVAEVNGDEIAKEDFEQLYTGQFQQAAMQQQMSGEEVNQDELKQNVAEGMVDQRLLIQEADNRDISVSEDDINETINQLMEQNEMESEDELFSALEEQGMSEDQVRTELEDQQKVEQLISDEAGEIEVTDEELEERYAQAEEQQEQMQAQMEEQSEGEGEQQQQEMPSFEEMEPQLEEQIVTEKEQETAQSIVENLREDADVTVHV